MKNINIVYIDDIEDMILEKFIVDWSEKPFIIQENSQVIKKNFSVIKFTSDMNYETLLENETIKQANVILIDNRLFEEKNAQSRFSGKQFKVVLRKLLPYIEVIIITQDSSINGINIVHKFSDENTEKSTDYYNNELVPKLDNAIINVLEFEDLALDLSNSNDVKQNLKEIIINSIHGNALYETLNKEDVNNLIEAFHEVKNAIDK